MIRLCWQQSCIFNDYLLTRWRKMVGWPAEVGGAGWPLPLERLGAPQPRPRPRDDMIIECFCKWYNRYNRSILFSFFNGSFTHNNHRNFEIWSEIMDNSVFMIIQENQIINSLFFTRPILRIVAKRCHIFLIFAIIYQEVQKYSRNSPELLQK